ncbi:MAG: carboxymuconolactone decarboxylase family protein [Chloroflexi bacterium]|nr:carboxymuconolactone decarboxylase family protein [Chloroflexota bacterium]
MTRVPYPDDDELAAGAGTILDDLQARRGYLPSLHRTLAHSPALLRGFLDLTAAIRDETALDAKLRELAILAIAQRTGAATQWLSHIPLARAAGLREEQVLALPVWRRHPAFSAEERAVIAFAEAATARVGIAEDVWAGVRVFLDDRQLVELAFVVGYYNLVARFLEALEVDTDREYMAEALQTSSMPT